MMTASRTATLETLSLADLEAHAAWEFVPVTSKVRNHPLRPLRGRRSSTGLVILRTRFTFADGSQGLGVVFTHPGALAKRRAADFMPLVLHGNRETLQLFHGVEPVTPAAARRMLERAGRSPSTTFPLTFRSDAPRIDDFADTVRGGVPSCTDVGYHSYAHPHGEGSR